MHSTKWVSLSGQTFDIYPKWELNAHATNNTALWSSIYHKKAKETHYAVMESNINKMFITMIDMQSYTCILLSYNAIVLAHRSLS